VKIERPKPEMTEDGRKIVYQIWRDDLAEAVILPKETDDSQPRTAGRSRCS
jgi:hypothetical protein